jgi:hypothetical protein
MGMLSTGLPASMNTTKTPIHMWRFNVPQLREFLAFSVTDINEIILFVSKTSMHTAVIESDP